MAVHAIPEPGEICLIPQAVWIAIRVQYSGVKLQSQDIELPSFSEDRFLLLFH